MAKCKTLPSVEEICAAYDAAFENLPDDLLGTVEGRREFISSALNYLKDDCAVVPSQQSLQMIIKELISYDTENYEGAMEFADNQEDVETLVTEVWDNYIDTYVVHIIRNNNTEQKLLEWIPQDLIPLIKNLKLSGRVYADDFAFIKKMKNLILLDLKDAHVFDPNTELLRQYDTIPKNALSYTNISTIILPATTKYIERAAFERCEKLKSIKIPEGVETIESFAFQFTGLTSITVPDSVTKIGSYVFASSFNLMSANMGNGLRTTGRFTFCKCANLQNIRLGDNVEIIDFGAFDSCLQLRYFEFPNKVNRICNSAFMSCERLTLFPFSFPSSLECIGEYCFNGCSQLKSVYIGDNIQTIGRKSFGKCDNLETVIISENMQWIEFNTFAECRKLREIYCKSKTPPVILREKFYGSKKKTLTLYVPIGCKEIYKRAPGWEHFCNIVEKEIYL